MKLSKKVKMIILFAIGWLLYYWPYIIVRDVEHWGPWVDSLGHIGMLIYFIYVFPILSIIYGVVSYKLTKEVIKPKLILGLLLCLYDMTMGVLGLFGLRLMGYYGFIIMAILPVISIVVSAIGKLISQSKKNKANNDKA